MEKLNLTFLRQARKDKRLRLAQAAKLIGKDKSTLCRYESGQIALTTDILAKLLGIYGLSVADAFINVKE